MNARTALLSWVAFGVAVWYGSLVTWKLVEDIWDYGTLSFPDSSSGRKELLIWVVWIIPTAIGVTAMMAPWIRKAWLFFGLGLPAHWYEELAEKLNTIGRWTVAGGFIFLTLIHGTDALLLLVPALMILSPEFGKFFVSGFTGFIDADFFPGGREARPPYTLKLAQFYVEKERWAEAEAEYERMLSFYPQEVEAWQERMRVAFRQVDGVEAAQDVLSGALKKLKRPEDQQAVHAVFASEVGKAGELH
jgi:hypothetical protein